MNTFKGIGSLEIALVIWSFLICLATVGTVSMLLTYRTDPNFFTTAAIMMSFASLFIVFVYARLAIAGVKKLETAVRLNRSVMFLWVAVVVLTVTTSLLPNPRADEYATQRLTYGVLIFSTIIFVHWLFWRRLRLRTQKDNR
jgi:hypothetical protein